MDIKFFFLLWIICIIRAWLSFCKSMHAYTLVPVAVRWLDPHTNVQSAATAPANALLNEFVVKTYFNIYFCCVFIFLRKLFSTVIFSLFSFRFRYQQQKNHMIRTSIFTFSNHRNTFSNRWHWKVNFTIYYFCYLFCTCLHLKKFFRFHLSKMKVECRKIGSILNCVEYTLCTQWYGFSTKLALFVFL